jgi:uncharacterized protein (DUF1697 family)
VPTTIALLRAVNVGGRTLPMADLRELVASLGFSDVRTYIQSGNVLFSSSRAPEPTVLEAAIEQRFGLVVDVILRSRAQLERALDQDPFPAADRARVYVGFMASKPGAAVVKGIDADAFSPEAFAIVGAELYLHLPKGMGRTKLPDYVLRRLKIPTTLRNWNTVTKLVELAGR